MSNKENISNKRDELLSKEKKLIAALESEATQVESNLQSTLKTLAIVAAGALAVTIIYKLTTPNKPTDYNNKKNIKGAHGKPSAITASVISIALQKLLPLAIEKFTSLNSKNQKNEKAAETTSR